MKKTYFVSPRDPFIIFILLLIRSDWCQLIMRLKEKETLIKSTLLSVAIIVE